MRGYGNGCCVRDLADCLTGKYHYPDAHISCIHSTLQVDVEWASTTGGTRLSFTAQRKVFHKCGHKGLNQQFLTSL